MPVGDSALPSRVLVIGSALPANVDITICLLPSCTLLNPLCSPLCTPCSELRVLYSLPSAICFLISPLLPVLLHSSMRRNWDSMISKYLSCTARCVSYSSVQRRVQIPSAATGCKVEYDVLIKQRKGESVSLPF